MYRARALLVSSGLYIDINLIVYSVMCPGSKIMKLSLPRVKICSKAKTLSIELKDCLKKSLLH